MSSPTEHSTHAHEHEHDHAKTYLAILIILLCLTGLTVAAAGVDFGSGNVVIALTIASVKAILVALFFMHLRYEKPVNGVIAAAGFLFLGLFLMFTLLDAGSRDNLQPVNLRPPLPPPTAPAAGAPGAAPAPAAAEKK
jgi:cytochrome c oxidase subunit 4